MDTIIRFFQGGGEFMYPILVVLVIGVAIAIERYIVLTATSFRNRSLWNEVAPLLKSGDYRKAVQLTSSSGSAVGQIKIGRASCRERVSYSV